MYVYIETDLCQPVKSRTMEQTVQINVEQTVSTLRVIM